jgi:cysteine desulfurase / selenocysteine lyase
MIDLNRVRADTPSCARLVHFNNAGASPTPEPVADAVLAHLALEREIGGYAAEADAEDQVENFYRAFAALLNCQPDEIAFVENATRAWDMAAYGQSFEPGDRIITCRSEYGSNYVAFLHLARTKGIVIDVAPDDEVGQVDVEGLAKLIRPNTKLIAITHVPTQGGLVNPAEAIGRVARASRVPYLLDACQSLGQMPVDVARIGCDFLSSTGRKFLRGPRGTGVLFARRDILERTHPPLIDAHAARWHAVDAYHLRDDARRFETFEGHVAGKIGLGRAVRYALDLGLENIWSRVRHLSDKLRKALSADHRTTVTDLGETRCGIVTFRLAGEEPIHTVKRMAVQGIQCWQSTIDWARLDFHGRNLETLVRLSVHYFNTEEEIERAAKVVLSV